MGDAVAVIWWLVGSCAVCSMRFLKGFSGIITSCRRDSITYCAVSKAAQKKGGASHE